MCKLQKISSRIKMNILILFSIFFFVVSSCNQEEDTRSKTPKEEVLTEVKDGIFTEYYPGKKQIKFQGGQDENKKRNGIWTFYAEDGTKLSITLFEHGIKEGHTIVNYPNGALRYRGEYHADSMVGLWTTYTSNGEIETEKDFGRPK